MATPRLVKVACPQCGAGMRLDPTARVVTCTYCSLSSFVHLPNQPLPMPPQDGQRYGTIHVPPSSRGPLVAVAVVSLVMVLALMVVGAATAIFLNKPASTPSGGGHASPHDDGTRRAGASDEESSVCAQTAACCKVVMRATSAGEARMCEAMRALEDAQCKKQLETFRDTAKTLGKKCD